MSDMEKQEKKAEEYMMDFLDASGADERTRVLEKMKSLVMPDVTDLMIDNMAASMDFVIKDGDTEDRFYDLMRCVKTRAKYENLRLRGL